eukprot:364601-Chlamydomonas_euryale.AAC.1
MKTLVSQGDSPNDTLLNRHSRPARVPVGALLSPGRPWRIGTTRRTSTRLKRPPPAGSAQSDRPLAALCMVPTVVCVRVWLEMQMR